jgi:hypothetical protein
MTDLNTLVNTNALIPGGSPLFLLAGCSINSSGVITGLAIETSTGDLHAYLATPAASSSTSSDETGVSAPVTLSESARELLRKRMPFGRRAAGLMPPQ